jgi:hypothetical protein
MRARDSRAVIFSILFGVSLVLPSSIGAEEARRATDGAPREPGDTMRSGGHASQTDWSRFRRILVHPLDVAYTTEFKNSRGRWRPSEFSSKDSERARRYFQQAFQNRLARLYPITTDPGSDVLRIDAVLVNPAPEKSWWMLPGKRLFRGEARVSLVVVLRDSETGAVLHRVDLPLRVSAGRVGFEESALHYWGYLRLVFDRVATRVRYALDDAPGSAGS